MTASLANQRVKLLGLLLHWNMFLRHESGNKEQSIANLAEKKSHDFG